MRFAHWCVRLTLVLALPSTALVSVRATDPSPAHFSVLAYGDSRGPVAAGYLAHLPVEWARLDRSVEGEIGREGHARLRAALPGLVDQDVEVVVLSWGASDAHAAAPDADDPTRWRDDFVAASAETLDRLLASGVVPVVVFPPPDLGSSPAAARANARLEDLEWPLALEVLARDVAFVDLFASVRAEPDAAALFATDGVHWSPAGEAFVARQVQAALAPVHQAWRAARDAR
jgi:lysophospholipase L1-like esterase